MNEVYVDLQKLKVEYARLKEIEQASIWLIAWERAVILHHYNPWKVVKRRSLAFYRLEKAVKS